MEEGLDAKARLAQLRTRLNKAVGFREATRQRLKTTQQDISRLDEEVRTLDLVGGLFRTLIDTEMVEGVQAVEKLLTEGLQVVFDDQDLSVRADVEMSRGRVSVDLVTVQRQPDGTVTEGISNDSFGGAVTTVESVLLRIILMLRRGQRRFLLLDETLPAMDDNYAVNMGRFLSLLCERLGMDIYVVSHHPALMEVADKAYRIQKVDGKATFKEIR